MPASTVSRPRRRATKVSVTGRADNLMGDAKVDAHVIGTLPLEDLLPLVPEGMAVDALGDAVTSM